jgi:hypothetical protein
MFHLLLLFSVLLESYQKNHCLYQYLEVFSSGSFRVSGLTLRSSIHLELIFMQGEGWDEFQSSACRFPVFPEPFIKEAILSPCFWHLCGE